MSYESYVQLSQFYVEAKQYEKAKTFAKSLVESVDKTKIVYQEACMFLAEICLAANDEREAEEALSLLEDHIYNTGQ